VERGSESLLVRTVIVIHNRDRLVLLSCLDLSVLLCACRLLGLGARVLVFVVVGGTVVAFFRFGPCAFRVVFFLGVGVCGLGDARLLLGGWGVLGDVRWGGRGGEKRTGSLFLLGVVFFVEGGFGAGFFVSMRMDCQPCGIASCMHGRH
jgi:hypothetical protein